MLHYYPTRFLAGLGLGLGLLLGSTALALAPPLHQPAYSGASALPAPVAPVPAPLVQFASFAPAHPLPAAEASLPEPSPAAFRQPDSTLAPVRASAVAGNVIRRSWSTIKMMFR